MRGWRAGILVTLVGLASVTVWGEEARMFVADLPPERVWAAALRAVVGVPLARTADGFLETAWTERAARPEEAGFTRVAERVTVRVEAAAPRLTRVSVEAVAVGLRPGGAWVPIGDSTATARDLLGRLRELASQDP